METILHIETKKNLNRSALQDSPLVILLLVSNALNYFILHWTSFKKVTTSSRDLSLHSWKLLTFKVNLSYFTLVELILQWKFIALARKEEKNISLFVSPLFLWMGWCNLNSQTGEIICSVMLLQSQKCISLTKLYALSWKNRDCHQGKSKFEPVSSLKGLYYF